MSLLDGIPHRDPLPNHHPWPRAIVGEEGWQAAIGELVAGQTTLLGFWGEPDAVHMALLEGLYQARSALVVLPFIDAYGGRERINVPSTVSAANWTYRLPWTVEELRGAVGAALTERLRHLAGTSARLG